MNVPAPLLANVPAPATVPEKVVPSPPLTVRLPVPPDDALSPPRVRSLRLFQVVPAPETVRLAVAPDCPPTTACRVWRVPPPDTTTFEVPWNSETTSDGVVAEVLASVHVAPDGMLRVSVPVPVWRTLSRSLVV